MSQRGRRLAVLFLLALTLRSLALLTPLGVDRLVGDEAEYASYARNLATRGVFEARWIQETPFKAHRTPIFPVLLAANHLLVGEEWFLRSAKITNAFVGSCIPILVFLCVELLVGVEDSRKRRAAFACGLVAAAYPYLILFGLMIMSEILFTTLALLTSYLLLRVAKRPDSTLLLAATGFAAGLATLTRPGFALFPGIACALLFFRLGSEHSSAKRSAWMAIVLGAYGVTLAPWLARNHREFGRFPVLATNGAEPFWIGNHPDSRGYQQRPVTTDAERREWKFAAEARDELERDRRFREMTLRHIREDPGRFVRLGVTKAVYLWNVETDYLRFLERVRRVDPMGGFAARLAVFLLRVSFPLLAVAFFASLLLGRPPRDRYLLTSFIAYSTALSVVVFGTSRFHVPFVPQLIICSSQLLLIERSVFERRPRLVALALVVLVYLAAVGRLRP